MQRHRGISRFGSASAHARDVIGRLASRSRKARFGDSRTRRNRGAGQSLVEFALILPALLLLTLIAIDFGRIYLGWINLQNMTRIAANFAANHPLAWVPGNLDADTITQYENQVLSDAEATNCPLSPATPASPTFTDATGNGVGTDIGDNASVTLTCTFSVVTPIISFIVGQDVPVTVTSVFPVKSALSATSSGGGGGGGCLAPSPAINANPLSGDAPLTVNFTDASGGGEGTAWRWHFDDGTSDSTLRDPGDHVFADAGTYTVTLEVTNTCGTFVTDPGVTITVAPEATEALCTVPLFNGVRFNDAQGMWGLPSPPGAGFTTTVQQGPGAPNGNFKIVSQTIVAGTSVPCSSTIFVNNP